MKLLSTTLIAAMFATTIPLVGCEKTVEDHTKTTTDDQGNVIKKDEVKKTVDPNGNTKTQETHTDNR